MVRKCSHCGKNGHNSRTCNSTRSMAAAGGVKLFGVQLHMASSSTSASASSSSSSSSTFPLKKSFSMECLTYSFPSSSSSPSSSTSSLGSIDEAPGKLSNGYLSDGLGGRTQERKKGVPWTEEEHRSFLAGLAKLGKGDWRGISRNFVTSRTPTQVASHAQKYFLRQSSLSKRKRRSSLFDVVASSEGAAHKASEAATTIDLNQPPSSSSQAQLSRLDLELRISSPRLNQNPSSAGNLCLGTVNAA